MKPERLGLAFPSAVHHKIITSPRNRVQPSRAWVAQIGQRRRAQNPVPWGFAGTNPAPRMLSRRADASRGGMKIVSTLQWSLLAAATIFNGILAGGSLIKSVVELPARRAIASPRWRPTIGPRTSTPASGSILHWA